MIMKSVILASTMLVCAVLPTFAQSPGKITDCTCRYKGQDIPVGNLVCLSSPEGPRLAQCGYFLNNTSWNFTKTPCLLSKNRYSPTDVKETIAKNTGGSEFN